MPFSDDNTLTPKLTNQDSPLSSPTGDGLFPTGVLETKQRPWIMNRKIKGYNIGGRMDKAKGHLGQKA